MSLCILIAYLLLIRSTACRGEGKHLKQYLLCHHVSLPVKLLASQWYFVWIDDRLKDKALHAIFPLHVKYYRLSRGSSGNNMYGCLKN